MRFRLAPMMVTDGRRRTGVPLSARPAALQRFFGVGLRRTLRTGIGEHPQPAAKWLRQRPKPGPPSNVSDAIATGR